jgi:hypothetical protein
MQSLATRRLTPELLDALPPADRRAMGSRRDLVWLNWIMRHDAMIAHALREGASAPPHSILELGAGDGRFMLRVARRLAPIWPRVAVTLLDRQELVSPTTRQAFTDLGWQVGMVRADVFEESAISSQVYDAITANLFLHHFEGSALRSLLAGTARRTNLFVAAEPRRAALAWASSQMIWALGCNDVSCHDARVSVEAGFKNHELSDVWPSEPAWSLNERRMGPFTHVFSASRQANEIK